MHSFFETQNTALQGVVSFPDWQYVRDGLRRSLGTTLAYYRRNPTAVKSNHFLVRLLQSITVPQSQNLLRYYDNVDAIALNVSMALKMTSSIYRGSLFNQVFYGEDSSEILIAHNEAFDIEQANRDWANLCPVKVLRHPRSDLGLGLLDGREHGIESGLAVVSINITMLAIQYRAFRLNEQAVVGDSESQRSVAQFIRMYVLPNMLLSHLDIALFNRLDAISRGAPLGASKTKQPFQLLEYSKKVDHVYKAVLQALERGGRNFTGELRTIPAVVKQDMEQALLLPDLAETQQVQWALTVARLPHLAFLCRTAKGGAAVRDQHLVTKILRSLLAYRTNNVMRTMLPVSEYLQVELETQAVEQAIKGD